MSLSEYAYTITTKAPSEEWTATEYKILYDGTGGGTFAKDSSQAAVTYICEYYHHEQFLDVVLGKTVKTGGGLSRSASSPGWSTSKGSRPEEHPFYYNFFASSATVEPLGRADNLVGQDAANWNKAKIVVVFRPPTYNIAADGTAELGRFVTRMPEGQADLQSTSFGCFKFVLDPQHRILELVPAFVVPAIRTTYTWHQIPTVTDGYGFPDKGKVPNLSTILGCVGRVNQYTFDGYPPGAVLFSTWSAKLVLPSCATDNNYYWDISYIFAVRDYGVSATPLVPDECIGWNYAFDPLNKRWDAYTTDGTVTGGTMYEYADLNTLFNVTW